MEERLRLVELMLYRGTTWADMYRVAKEKWGAGHGHLEKLIRRVEARWRKKWERDPERLEARREGFESLLAARRSCHEVLADRSTKPRERVAAASALARVELSLAKIGGYYDPDVLAVPPPPADGNEGTTQPVAGVAVVVASQVALVEYMGVVVREAEGRVLQAPSAPVEASSS